jgi:hypothetical protein
MLPWVLCGVWLWRAGIGGMIITVPPSVPTEAALTWPFSRIFDTRHQTNIVVADSSYGDGTDTFEPAWFAANIFTVNLLGPEASKIGGKFQLSEYLSIWRSLRCGCGGCGYFVPDGGRYRRRCWCGIRRTSGCGFDHNYVFIGSPDRIRGDAASGQVELPRDRRRGGKQREGLLNMNPLPSDRAQYEGLR